MLIKELSFLIGAFILSFLLYPFWINFLYKAKLREKLSGLTPENHHIKQGTPTMGGVVFTLILVLITLFFNLSRKQTLFAIVVIFTSSILGLVEDLYKAYTRSELRSAIRVNVNKYISRSTIKIRIYDLFLMPWNIFRELARTFASTSDTKLKPHYKLILQMIIGFFIALWVYIRLEWTTLWLPLMGEINLGIFYPLLVFIIFIFTLNAIAISDGLDGLTAGLGIISLISFWVISSNLGYLSLSLLTSTFIGSLLAFLYFNIHPARIFMGDVGSYAVSSAIFMIALILRREFVLFFVSSVLLFDGFSSVLQQFWARFLKRKLFKMAPIHHHFEVIGWHETKIVMRFWLAGALTAFIGILIALL